MSSSYDSTAAMAVPSHAQLARHSSVHVSSCVSTAQERSAPQEQSRTGAVRARRKSRKSAFVHQGYRVRHAWYGMRDSIARVHAWYERLRTCRCGTHPFACFTSTSAAPHLHLPLTHDTHRIPLQPPHSTTCAHLEVGMRRSCLPIPQLEFVAPHSDHVVAAAGTPVAVPDPRVLALCPTWGPSVAVGATACI